MEMSMPASSTSEELGVRVRGRDSVRVRVRARVGVRVDLGGDAEHARHLEREEHDERHAAHPLG